MGKSVLGTVSGGKRGQPLTISFSADVDRELAQRVVRRIGFQTRKANVGTRKIEFEAFDATGANNPPFSKTVVVGNPV